VPGRTNFLAIAAAVIPPTPESSDRLLSMEEKLGGEMKMFVSSMNLKFEGKQNGTRYGWTILKRSGWSSPWNLA
jgi:hypothetical protein